MLNLSLFSLTHVDSALLRKNVSIVHQFTEAGEFWIGFYNEQAQIQKKSLLQVSDHVKTFVLNMTCGDKQDDKACSCTDDEISEYTLRAGGFMHLQGSENGYFVLLYKAGDKKVLWDSRKLDAGDVFAFMLLRPGKYIFSNYASGAENPLTVTYPDPRQNSKMKKIQFEQIKLKTFDEWNWDPVSIRPGQGVVIEVDKPSRFYGDLREADDGPADLKAWRNELNRNLI